MPARSARVPHPGFVFGRDGRWVIANVGLLAAGWLMIAAAAGGCAQSPSGGDGRLDNDFSSLDPGQAGEMGRDQPFSTDAQLDVPGLDHSPADATSSGDGGPPPDGGSDGGSTKYRCDPACGPNQLCTSNMRCAAVLTLSGDPIEVIQRLAQAQVDCWNYAAADGNHNTLCYAIDTRAATVSINDAMYDDWVCNTATATDFANGQTDLDTARDLSGCGGLTDADNTDFKVGELPPHTAGDFCLAFDNTLVNENLLAHCVKFDEAGYPAASF